jgi:uncharacterized RmlC-like cupin family protein
LQGPRGDLLKTPQCRIARRPSVQSHAFAGEPFVGKQDFTYAPAISAETAGASAIHMKLLTVPTGARAKAYKHEAHETALCALSGEVAMYYGEKLKNHMVTRASDFVYIPANTPYLPSPTRPTADADKPWPTGPVRRPSERSPGFKLQAA